MVNTLQICGKCKKRRGTEEVFIYRHVVMLCLEDYTKWEKLAKEYPHTLYPAYYDNLEKRFIHWVTR